MSTPLSLIADRRRRHILSWARTFANRDEDPTVIDDLIARAVGYRPPATRDRLDLDRKYRDATPEDRAILKARLARIPLTGVARRTFLESLND